MMIRSFYGLTQNPFDLRELVLLPHQQEIHDTLKVHCQQGGLCLVLGVPGSGKIRHQAVPAATSRESAPRRHRRTHLAHLHQHRQDPLRRLPHRIRPLRLPVRTTAHRASLQPQSRRQGAHHHPRRRPPHGPGQPPQTTPALRGLPQESQPRSHRPAQPPRQPRSRRQPRYQEPASPIRSSSNASAPTPCATSSCVNSIASAWATIPSPGPPSISSSAPPTASYARLATSASAA